MVDSSDPGLLHAGSGARSIAACAWSCTNTTASVAASSSPPWPNSSKPPASAYVTGELQGSHDPPGVVFTVLAALSGMEREYIRDRTLEGHESARGQGKSIGEVTVVDEPCSRVGPRPLGSVPGVGVGLPVCARVVGAGAWCAGGAAAQCEHDPDADVDGDG